MDKIIQLFKVYMSPKAKEAVGEVLDCGYIGQGKKVDELEAILKERFKNDYVVTTNAATSAEHLALHLLKKPYVGVKTYGGVAFSPTNWAGIKDGEEVLATPLTCTASNFPILANNLRIKWVDVDPKTLNMDLDDLARKISSITAGLKPLFW